jgi:hypothetical protein
MAIKKSVKLERVDIQEVMHDVAEGNLELIPTSNDAFWLEREVNKLEHSFGNLDKLRNSDLFGIERALLLPENKELKKRWDLAIRLSTKIRMNLLRCKALSMLEFFDNDTKAPINAFCKTVLADVLSENTERIKAKYGVRTATPNSTNEDDEADDLTRELEGRDD